MGRQLSHWKKGIMSVARQFVGEKRIYWEKVLKEDESVITPSSATATLYNRDTGVSIATLTVTSQAGLVKTVVSDTQILAAGNYQIDWFITYLEGSLTGSKAIKTDIIAELRDSTYIMTFVPRLRIYVDDDPSDVSLRIKDDDQWKRYLVEGIRNKMSDYSITQNLYNQDEIDPEPTAGSADEKLIILWGAYFYFVFGAQAIAAERTQLYSISYDDALQQIQSRIDWLEEQIGALDPDSAMQFIDETDIVNWGKTSNRLIESIEQWDE